MKVIGDIKSATKFYIINSRGSIEWVPNLEVAKSYVNNPSNVEWYNKDIYATDEKMVKDKHGIVKLASQLEKKVLIIKTIKKAFEDFKDQANDYINSKLTEFANKYQYDSIFTMISWQNSEIQQYKDEALKAIKYRDMLYNYHFDFINNLNNKIQHNELETSDLSYYYDQYLTNFPKEQRED